MQAMLADPAKYVVVYPMKLGYFNLDLYRSKTVVVAAIENLIGHLMRDTLGIASEHWKVFFAAAPPLTLSALFNFADSTRLRQPS